MTHTTTVTASTTVTATATRVAYVLRRVRGDLISAAFAGLADEPRIKKWIDDLQYMLVNDALKHFELRVEAGGRLQRAWRYSVSDDGTLLESGRSGGIDLMGMPVGSTAEVIITRRSNLNGPVNDEINRRGWTTSVAALLGSGQRERAYSKDGYGVVREQF